MRICIAIHLKTSICGTHLWKHHILACIFDWALLYLARVLQSRRLWVEISELHDQLLVHLFLRLLVDPPNFHLKEAQYWAMIRKFDLASPIVYLGHLALRLIISVLISFVENPIAPGRSPLLPRSIIGVTIGIVFVSRVKC